MQPSDQLTNTDQRVTTPVAAVLPGRRTKKSRVVCWIRQDIPVLSRIKIQSATQERGTLTSPSPDTSLLRGRNGAVVAAATQAVAHRDRFSENLEKGR